MWNILFTTFNAIAPVILLIALGYLLKRIKFLNANFLKIGNKFVFNIGLPCMLFINVYDSMQSFSDIRWDVVLYALIVIVVIFAFGLLTAVLTTKNPKRRGVIVQCTYRSNFAIIGLTLVERLGGDVGIAGIVSAFSIPLFNVLSVIALSMFTDGTESVTTVGDVFVDESVAMPKHSKKEKLSKHIKSILLNIVKNPLIIGAVLGMACIAVREIERLCFGGNVVFRLDTQFKFVYTAIKDIKLISSPFALIVLGGQFEFSAVKGMTKEIIVGTIWRIVITPVIAIGVSVLLTKYTGIVNFGSEVYPTYIALFATPVAVASAVMAGEMHNDEQLATQLIVWTSMGSIITIFLFVFVLMATGFIVV